MVWRATAKIQERAGASIGARCKRRQRGLGMAYRDGKRHPPRVASSLWPLNSKMEIREIGDPRKRLSSYGVHQALAQAQSSENPENFPISWALIPAAPGR